jgi:hypothetical protein
MPNGKRLLNPMRARKRRKRLRKMLGISFVKARLSPSVLPPQLALFWRGWCVRAGKTRKS